MKKIYKILFFVGILFITNGCSDKKKDDFSKNLLKSFKNNTFVHLDSLINQKGESICIVYPYGDSISSANSNANKINKKLKEQNIIANEDEWYLIVVSKNDGIVAMSVKRKEIDVVDFKMSKENKLPNNFQSAQCVDFRQALLYQTLIKNRKYIILGEKI